MPRMAQHFRPTLTDPGYDVVSENRYFVARLEVEWEELSFSVNGTKWGVDRPPFPLLQPEKLLSLPLQLRFDDGYRLQARAAASASTATTATSSASTRCVRTAHSTGERCGSTRKRLPGSACTPFRAAFRRRSSRTTKTQRYAPVVVGNRPVFLFSGLTARQIVLIAGRNLLVEKSVDFSDFHVNPETFDRDRASARESDRRDVSRNRQRPALFREGARASGSSATARRITRRRWPSGRRSIRRTRFRCRCSESTISISGSDHRISSWRFCLPASLLPGTSSDRRSGTRISTPAWTSSRSRRRRATGSTAPTGSWKACGLLTWPLSTGFNLGWQATPFQKATFQYQFRFDGYVKDRTTADAFEVPVEHRDPGLGGAWEYRRAGYSLLLNGTWFGARRGSPGGCGLRAGTTPPA